MDEENLRKSAEAGDPEAMFQLARILINSERESEAFNWAKKALSAGRKSAAALLAFCYWHGIEVEQSLEQAETYYREATSEGDPIILRNYAHFLLKEKPSPETEAEALPILRKCLADGDGAAALSMAEHLIAKHGQYIHSFSPEEARPILELFNAAHSLGVPCSDQIGNFYFRLHALSPESETQALKWLRLAADSGEAHSMYELGRLLSTGEFIDLDFDAAEKWLNEAARLDIEPAYKGLEYIALMRTPEGRDHVAKMQAANGYPPPRIPKGLK